MNIRELRNIFGKVALVCLAGGGIAGTASAATYYVGTSGNDGNPGTQTAPWRTIAKAANAMVAGDSAIVTAGSYGEKGFNSEGRKFGQADLPSAHPATS